MALSTSILTGAYITCLQIDAQRLQCSDRIALCLHLHCRSSSKDKHCGMHASQAVCQAPSISNGRLPLCTQGCKPDLRIVSCHRKIKPLQRAFRSSQSHAIKPLASAYSLQLIHCSRLPRPQLTLRQFHDSVPRCLQSLRVSVRMSSFGPGSHHPCLQVVVDCVQNWCSDQSRWLWATSPRCWKYSKWSQSALL